MGWLWIGLALISAGEHRAKAASQPEPTEPAATQTHSPTDGLATAPTAVARRLTHDGRLKSSPVFVAGGREVLYVVLDTPELFRLMRLSLDDGTITAYNDLASTTELDPAASPDGELVAFCRTVSVLNLPLVLRGPNGVETVIPAGGGFCGFRSPAVAPDKSRVAVSYAEGGRQQLYSFDRMGKDRRALTDSPGLNLWPTYSPCGKFLAFGSSRDGDYELYCMGADGANPRRLTESPRQDIRPAWSPKGDWIAFTSHRDGNAEVYLLAAGTLAAGNLGIGDDSDTVSDSAGNDTATTAPNPAAATTASALIRVTDHPERDDYPAWHPDGERLVIVSERDGEYDLYLVDLPEEALRTANLP